MATFSANHNAVHPAQYRHAAPVAAPVVPAGTFVPGTIITVGAHTVTIERYLSEGGFAHVYLVRLQKPINGTDVAVLKRVAVPDKEALANMRTEVETMKRLKGHRHIVTYFDSHASHLKTGGYEVFLLMEYCAGGGLIDFMNTRLKNRLTEPEVLHIFNDVAEGVACMHYLQPPLLHRDLKVENVLIAVGSSRRYVLCDFGSSAAPRRTPPSNPAECRQIEEDVMRHTTLQYRSPEMVDVYRKIPIDEKSDIWALGVLLYKLCYYTTPFEDQGQLAILNATFTFPMYPEFSDRLKALIASMLRESPQLRPNIYQVLREVCAMRGKPIPIKDIYGPRSSSSVASPQKSVSPPIANPSVIAYSSPQPKQQVALPEITPMRRGRPTRASNPIPASVQASHSKTRVSTDPFAALDNPRPATATPASLASTVAIPSPEDAFARFPSLDQFDLLHQSGGKYEFKDPSPKGSPKKDLNTRVLERLADEAFAKPVERRPGTMERERLVAEAVKTGELSNLSTARPLLYEPKPTRPQMSSKGTMTSPPPSPPLAKDARISPGLSSAPPAEDSDNAYDVRRPNLIGLHRTSTQPSMASTHLTASATLSSRPSLEVPRPSLIDSHPGISRSKSANSKPRPSSVHIESNMDFLRDLNSATTATASPGLFETASTVDSESPKHIPSNVDFLRSMETPSPPANVESHHRKSVSSTVSSLHRHAKRASMPSINLGHTKSLLTSKFGEAFRRFEHPGPSITPQPPITPPSPSNELSNEWNTLSPESRRELEKRRQEAEERRVRQKAEEYKRNLGAQPNSTSRPSTATASVLPEKPQTRVRTTVLIENTRAASPLPALSPGNVPLIDLSKPPPPAPPAKPVKLRTGTSGVLKERGPARSDASGAIPDDDWERGFEKRFPAIDADF